MSVNTIITKQGFATTAKTHGSWLSCDLSLLVVLLSLYFFTALFNHGHHPWIIQLTVCSGLLCCSTTILYMSHLK